ncbi:MAG: roadblock/LC7 domain-containing protein [Candidatus Thorarchaeota archaeon]
MSKRIINLDAILRDLEQNCDLIGSALVSSKGQMIYSSLRGDGKERAVSAMAAAISSIVERVGTELDAGTMTTTIIDGSIMSVILRKIDQILLLGIAPLNSEIGLIDFELNRATEKISDEFRI